MKRKKIFFAVGFMAFLIVSMFLSTNVLAEEITIKGEVNDKYQIVTDDGQIYEVAGNDKGDEMALNNVGKIVSITGTVEESDESDEGNKIVTVISYEVENIE